MTLIDGVGDEVVQFMAVVLMVVVASLAWWSTNARPDRYRTVLVMRSRNHPVTVSIRQRLNPIGTNTASSNTTSSMSEGSSTRIQDETVRENSRVIPLQEMDSIVDADMAMVNHHRLHFYRRLDTPTSTPNNTESSDESEAQDETETENNAQVAEMDSIVNAMEADSTAEPFARTPESTDPIPAPNPVQTPQPQQTNEEANTVTTETSVEVMETAEQGAGESESIGENKILIRLKYLNDTLKEVEGSLDELLKDFKWRHFSRELSSQCRVRLIFNGRVLSEAATLRAQGLSHQAVVHCLVHPALPQSARHQRNQADDMPSMGVGMGLGVGAGAATHELVTEGGAPERSWDLENILMTLVSVALTVVWFFRCEYSNMFTASASVALFGLTVFYSVAIFGLYLSDTFHLDRRAPHQPHQPHQPLPPLPDN